MSPSSNERLIFSADNFSEWTSLNDTIMGGTSNADCRVTSEGLLLEGNLIEEDGGFVSCRSNFFTPSLNLSKYRALHLELDGYGRTLKLALICRGRVFGISEFFQGGLCWVAEVPTNVSGTTRIDIPFNSLRPTIRAKKVRLPVFFDSSRISQFQLLHSKFGLPGELNSGFRPGSITILLRSISADF